MAMIINDEDPVKSALRNELILQEIFNFLPLKTLLLATEIDKFWNFQVRTYFRDHRKCTAFVSACCQLEELDQALAGMTIVPFNSLSIKLRPHAEPIYYRPDPMDPTDTMNPPGPTSLLYRNLFTKLKLKHLSISGDYDDFWCPLPVLIFRLLTRKDGQLKSLSFYELSPAFVELCSARDKFEFTQLEELQLLNLNDWTDNNDEGLLRKILDGAPKLNGIIHNGSQKILTILPETKFKFLKQFECNGFHNEKMSELARRLVDSRPKLSELSGSLVYDELDMPTRYCSMFESLVQSSSSSLKSLNVSGAPSMEKLGQFPLLPSVTLLNLWNNQCQAREFVQKFPLIKLGELFPKLEKIHLEMPYVYHRQLPSPPSTTEEKEIDVEFSDSIVQDPPPYSSTTATSLNLNMEVCPALLLQLKQSFPNIVQLEISEGSNTMAYALPYQQIFRLWPNLKNLTVKGQCGSLLPNCDAEFCGIHQEEAELLQCEKDEYLRNVHIVPARPSVSTMKHLESLSIDFRLRLDSNSANSDPRVMFLSPVTEFVVFKRMPWVKFSVNVRDQDSFFPGDY